LDLREGETMGRETEESEGKRERWKQMETYLTG
jgi:hypothetical protein